MKKPRLMTSNTSKLAEFRRLGLDADMDTPGPDIPEVDSDPVTVAVMKALHSGAGAIVEDTSLDVEGADVGVEVRWLIDKIKDYDGRAAVFRVILAYNDGEEIKVSEGIIKGKIDANKASDSRAFGFDPWFVPEESNGLSLWELEVLQRKDDFSARAKAVRAFNSLSYIETRGIQDIREWNGDWQQGKKPSI